MLSYFNSSFNEDLLIICIILLYQGVFIHILKYIFIDFSSNDSNNYHINQFLNISHQYQNYNLK
jgi:hypothetical protein